MTTMIGLPLVSIAMFILAGILIGHLLWYHDRKADLWRISKLEDRYQLVRGTALWCKQEFVRLQSEVSSHQQLLDETRAETNAAITRQQQADEEARAAKSQLLQFERERQELTEQLQTESHRNESVVAQLKEALQSKADVESRLAETSQSSVSAEEISATYRDRIEELQQANLQDAEHHKQEIEKLRTVVAEQAAAAAQTTRDKEAAILRLKSELESQQQTDNESSQAIQSVQHKLQSLSDELETVQADRERLNQALAEKSEELTQLQSGRKGGLEQSEATIAELSAKLAETNRELQKTASEHKQSIGILSQQQAEKDELTKQMQTHVPLKNELQQAKAQIAEHQANIEQQAHLIANQQSELSQQTELAKTKESELVKLHQREKELRKSLSEFDATKQQLAEVRQQVSVLAADRDKLSQTYQSLQEEAHVLREKPAEDGRATKQLQNQLSEKDQLIRELTTKFRESEKQLELKSVSASKLSMELFAAEKLRPENGALQKRLDEMIGRLKAVTAEHEDSLQSNAKAEDRIRDLQNQLHEHANKIRDQRRQLASVGELSTDDASPKDGRKAA